MCSPQLLIENVVITDDSSTFFIAEIGQNHQGDINIAKELIKTAKRIGVDCVKFQKTDIKEKFNEKALKREYNNQNSWGKTYQEHKEYLEFSDEEFHELQRYAKEFDIFFTASAMDLNSLKFLHSIDVPFIKLGSGDANNFILIEEAAKLDIPLIISTGMQSLETVEKIYKIVKSYHNKFAILHCISAYPTPYEDVNLRVISLYKTMFPDIIIGYSGHELGIDIAVCAVGLGAKIIERHITLDKHQKGTDHQCSLLPNEFKEMIDKTRHLEAALGRPIKEIRKSEIACYQKLGKSLVTSKPLKVGHKILLEDLKIKVAEPKGIDAVHIIETVGKRVQKELDVDESITPECIS